jgi:hypothetical protein
VPLYTYWAAEEAHQRRLIPRRALKYYLSF